MIVPSIDIQNGNAVQLVGGETLEIDAGNPRPIAAKFARVGEIAVIDLDAAMSKGSNTGVIRELCAQHPCRVGGGIRDVDTATRWLDAGARKVILGTAAKPDILKELPRDRVIAALDARHDKVVVEGWTKESGHTVDEQIDALKDHVGGFLITFVEREGRMQGLPEDRIRELVERAAPARVTVAGGVKDAGDVALADRLGADAQVGMALYTGAVSLADAFAAPLTSDRPDGLIPTVVTDESGVTLGLTYSDRESLNHAIDTGDAAYHSRSRDELWVKGATSGDTQALLRVTADCDRDALRFTVRQRGHGFCHLRQHTCFGDHTGLAALERTLRDRLATAPEGSYTRRLFSDADLLRKKLIEEAGELAAATNREEAAWEAADLIFFALTAATARGVTVADIERTLDARALKVTRRPGNAKPHIA